MKYLRQIVKIKWDRNQFNNRGNSTSKEENMENYRDGADI